jgi:hypothetical protein
MASPLCVTLFSTSVTYKVWALLEPRKAVNMAEEKKRKIQNVTIAVKLTVYVVVALHVVEISVFVFAPTQMSH